MTNRIAFLVFGASALAFMSVSPARAQQAPGEISAAPVWEAASGGAIAERRPGRVVQMGMLRARVAHARSINHARNGPEITEVAPPIDEGSALRAALITELFSGLDSAIQLLASVIGLPVDDTPDDPDSTDLSDLLGTITDSSD